MVSTHTDGLLICIGSLCNHVMLATITVLLHYFRCANCSAMLPGLHVAAKPTTTQNRQLALLLHFTPLPFLNSETKNIHDILSLLLAFVFLKLEPVFLPKMCGDDFDFEPGFAFDKIQPAWLKL